MALCFAVRDRKAQDKLAPSLLGVCLWLEWTLCKATRKLWEGGKGPHRTCLL